MTGIVSPGQPCPDSVSVTSAKPFNRLSLVICARSYTHITPLSTPISIDRDRQINTSKWPSNRYVRFVVSSLDHERKGLASAKTRDAASSWTAVEAFRGWTSSRSTYIDDPSEKNIGNPRSHSLEPSSHSRPLFARCATQRKKKVEKIEITGVTDRARSCLRQRGESLEKTNRFFENTDKLCFRVCLRCRWTLRKDRSAGTTINRMPWRILDKIVPSLSCVGLANYPTFFVESRDPRQRGSNPLEIVAVINCVAI